MFSAFFSSQNKLFTQSIISVTWSIPGNTTSTYTGSSQSVTVISINPVGATYSTSTTSALDAGDIATTTITGTGIYTGSFTSPTLTITQATISGTAANPNVTYNGSSQTGTVITNVLPVGATYSGSVSASGTNAGTFTSSITGTGNYTGTVNGGNLTINPKTLTLTSSGPTNVPPFPSSCWGFSVAGFELTIGGLIGSDTVNIVALNGNTVGATSIAPVGTNPNLDGNCVTNSRGDAVNPKTISGASSVNYTFYMAVNDGGNYYWFSVNNSSYVSKNNNYTTPSTYGYYDDSCGT